MKTLRASAPPRETTWPACLDTPVIQLAAVTAPPTHRPTEAPASPDHTACLAQLSAIRLQLDKIAILLDAPRLSIAIPARIKLIKQLVATQFGVPLLAIDSRRGKENVVTARHVAIHLVRLSMALNHSEIGQHFHKEHTSITHALQAIKTRRETDPTFATLLTHLELQILQK